MRPGEARSLGDDLRRGPLEHHHLGHLPDVEEDAAVGPFVEVILALHGCLPGAEVIGKLSVFPRMAMHCEYRA